MNRVWIAGGTGYIGSATVRAAREAGFAPVVLTRSPDKAAALKRDGIDAVVGDLEQPGTWEASLNCTHAIFLAAPPTWGKRVSIKVASAFRDGLVRLTRGFFSALKRMPIERAVYIAGTSFYGDAGDGAPRTETDVGAPKGWGPYLAPAVDLVTAEIKAGTPVVLAFPGQVYGPASWNEQLFLQPLSRGKAITGLKGHEPYFSPIHVDDCGRAVVHLLSHGANGERYILVDNEPLRAREFGAIVAHTFGTPLKTRSVPTWLCNLLLGPVLTEYATAHTNFSNQKLRATGFTLRFPTCRQGLPEVIKQWQTMRMASSGRYTP